MTKHTLSEYGGLRNFRRQRRDATSLMRNVNEAYKLSNPSSWYEKIVKNIEKAATGFKRVFMSQKQEPTRVRPENQSHSSSQVN